MHQLAEMTGEDTASFKNLPEAHLRQCQKQPQSQPGALPPINANHRNLTQNKYLIQHMQALAEKSPEHATGFKPRI